VVASPTRQPSSQSTRRATLLFRHQPAKFMQTEECRGQHPSSVPALFSGSLYSGHIAILPRSGIRHKGVHAAESSRCSGKRFLPVTLSSGPRVPGRVQPLPIHAATSVRQPDCGDNAERAWRLHRKSPRDGRPDTADAPVMRITLPVRFVSCQIKARVTQNAKNPVPEIIRG